MSPVALEVCVDTLEGAWIAAENGADRIELCAALSEGGLTPSFGAMTAAAKLPVPVYAMIRPRRGDFRYSDIEKTAMLHDIEACGKAGLAGIVIGAVDDQHALDREFLAAALESTSLPATLHRAIDTVRDYEKAVADAIKLGFERILSSGQADKAELGMDRLASAVRVASGRISIMAGSGVNAANAPRILKHTGAPELHASCSKPKGDAPAPGISETRLGFVAATGTRDTDASLVQSLRHVMDIHAEDAA
ncbi:copper homeostasis protein CutC [Roseibium sediminicola]|uniref:PF03932 family protein CutC n=1 Tax=Roseibium sediminicola TaxID=2933272 RepID=A0ABT0GQG7_9HYPH|nr:copper homeostasis protein CutC [Roseibium sp. CAU 1639]MCK7611561.1 copper homeostasis protein CutC [Roseibium sp. CAU 1639]